MAAAAAAGAGLTQGGNMMTSVLGFGHQYYQNKLNIGAIDQSFGAFTSASNAILEKSYTLSQNNVNENIHTAETAYTKAGLPNWLAFTPSALNSFSRTSQSLGGENYMTSALPGQMTSAFTGMGGQSALGMGAISQTPV